MIILFFFLTMLLFYLPGQFLLRLTKYPRKPVSVFIFLSITIGIGGYLLGTYALSWIHMAFLYPFLLIPVIFYETYYLVKIRKILQFDLKRFVPEGLLLVIGSAFMSYITWNSGVMTTSGMVFYGVNGSDGIFHLSLIGNLTHTFPPTYPGLSGVLLHGYNFFYDFLVATFAELFHFSVVDLFFRYFPLFISLIYGLSFLSVGKFLKMNRSTSLILLFLAYFSQSWLFIFSLFHLTADPGITQPVANIVDPSVILSILFFNAVVILLFSNRTLGAMILSAVLIGLMPMIKVYTAVLLYIGVIVLLVMRSITKKEKDLFLVLALSVGIAAATYLPTNLGAGSLIFSPFLLYQHFFESFSAANHLHWVEQVAIFQQHTNYLRIFLLYALSLLIFYVPTLSIRLIVLTGIPQIFKKTFYTEKNIFFLTIFMCGFILPSLFIQSVAVFVTIQFLWILNILLLIPAAFLYRSLFGKMTRYKIGLCFGLLILLSLPGSISLFNNYSTTPLVLSHSLVKTALIIHQTLPAEKQLVVLNAAEKDNRISTAYTVPLMSALSAHDVYYEPEWMDFSGLERVTAKRKEQVATMGKLLTNCSQNSLSQLQDLLDQTQIAYLVSIEKNPCLESPAFRAIAVTGNYGIYTIK